MAEVAELIKELSQKFDTLREDVDSLKERCGKQKKSKRSHHRRHAIDPIRGLGADPSPGGPHTAREEGNLGEIYLLVIEAFLQVLGEEHVANLTTGDRPLAAWKQVPGVEKKPGVALTLCQWAGKEPPSRPGSGMKSLLTIPWTTMR